MLIRLRFSNFHSFRDEYELSLVAAPFTDKPDIPRKVEVEQFDSRLLPACAIYGANASGKTNVLRAISFIAHAVSFSHSQWKPDAPIPHDPFLFEDSDTSSRFEIEFVTEGVRYQYGFRVSKAAVLEEWLHAYPKGHKQAWFHRREGVPISFSTKLVGENKTIENLTRKNSLFLSAAAQNNHTQLLGPYRWITQLLFVMDERGRYIRHTAELCKSADYLDQVSRLISAADFGITGLKVEKQPLPDHAAKVSAALKPLLDERQGGAIIPSHTEEIRLLHHFSGKDVFFTPQQESHGTLTYLGLLGPVVDALKTGRPLIVDELESSLHTLLCMHLIRLFNDKDTNPLGAQLIFDTHDTNLLSSGLLRRDQIWFTEKMKDGSSSLFPLSDFKLRKTDKLESGYLLGRYGGIPFIDSESFLSGLERVDAETR